MLFSITETGWWLIALVATVLFMALMGELVGGMRFPHESPAERMARARKSRRGIYLMTPLVGGLALALAMVRPVARAEILFLYSAMFAAIPLALYPVRGRMVKSVIAQRRNPGTEIKPDLFTKVWVIGVLSVALLGCVVALMATGRGATASSP
ncbi:hypothetical protein [Streptomyces specialis]|uniref:hypothetical protein n=1 Tax=Streptomyces specialis TaxID=498367 RepID=UPI00073E8C8E|nr:hypothetical protein [Streptomyces specialis]